MKGPNIVTSITEQGFYVKKYPNSNSNLGKQIKTKQLCQIINKNTQNKQKLVKYPENSFYSPFLKKTAWCQNMLNSITSVVQFF